MCMYDIYIFAWSTWKQFLILFLCKFSKFSVLYRIKKCSFHSLFQICKKEAKSCFFSLHISSFLLNASFIFIAFLRLIFFGWWKRHHTYINGHQTSERARKKMIKGIECHIYKFYAVWISFVCKYSLHVSVHKKGEYEEYIHTYLSSLTINVSFSS